MSDEYRVGDIVQYIDSHPDMLSDFNGRQAEILAIPENGWNYRIKMCDNGSQHHVDGTFWKPRNEKVSCKYYCQVKEVKDRHCHCEPTMKSMNRNGANS